MDLYFMSVISVFWHCNMHQKAS